MEAAHGTHYTEILFTPNCSPKATGSFPFHFICKTHLWSAFLYDVHFWSYRCHSSLIFTFLPIFPIQNALFWARTTAHKLHCKMLPVIPYCSGRAKGVQNFSPMWNGCVYIVHITTQCVDLDQWEIALKRHSAQGCAFQGSERCSPKFWGSNVKNLKF